MTTTWEDKVSGTTLGRQFDSDSRTLMIDDGASACITNDKGDFVEPPQESKLKSQRHQGTRQGHPPRHD